MPPREPTIVFHVGAVPTASRLLQRCLSHNSAVWPANTHILADATLRRDVASGKALVADPEGLAGTLRGAFDEKQIDIVVGTRALLGPAFGGSPGSGLHAEADATIEALAEATQPYRRVIVLSVCPQAQLLEMHFEEAIAGRSAARLVDWLDSVDLDNLSWLPLHDKLTAAFGSESVVVHDFRRTERGRVDFLRAVIAAAELRLPENVAKKTPPPELRLSETGVRLAIAADPHLFSNGQRGDLRSFLQRHFSELEGPPGTLLTEVQKDALHQRYDGEFGSLGSTASVGVGGGQ